MIVSMSPLLRYDLRGSLAVSSYTARSTSQSSLVVDSDKAIMNMNKITKGEI